VADWRPSSRTERRRTAGGGVSAKRDGPAYSAAMRRRTMKFPRAVDPGEAVRRHDASEKFISGMAV